MLKNTYNAFKQVDNLFTSVCNTMVYVKNSFLVKLYLKVFEYNKSRS